MAASLRNLVGMLSGPEALWGFRPFSSFFTPSMPISKAGTSGYGLGSSEGKVDESSSMKARANLSLKMLALTWGSLWVTPSFLNEDIPLLSHVFALTKDHRFFGSLSSPEKRSST